MAALRETGATTGPPSRLRTTGKRVRAMIRARVVLGQKAGEPGMRFGIGFRGHRCLDPTIGPADEEAIGLDIDKERVGEGVDWLGQQGSAPAGDHAARQGGKTLRPDAIGDDGGPRGDKIVTGGEAHPILPDMEVFNGFEDRDAGICEPGGQAGEECARLEGLHAFGDKALWPLAVRELPCDDTDGREHLADMTGTGPSVCIPRGKDDFAALEHGGGQHRVELLAVLHKKAQRFGAGVGADGQGDVAGDLQRRGQVADEANALAVLAGKAQRQGRGEHGVAGNGEVEIRVCHVTGSFRRGATV